MNWLPTLLLVLTAVATVSAVARLRRDRPLVRGLVYAGAALALVTAVAALVIVDRPAGEPAIASVAEALTLPVIALLALFLGLSFWLRGAALGLFMLPLVFLLAVLAATLPAPQLPGRWPEVPQAVALVHVLLTMAGVSLVGFAGLCGLMYVVYERRLRRGRIGRLAEGLPNLEWLERHNRRAAVAGFVLLTIGLGLGLAMLWRWGERLGLGAGDPKVVASLAVWVMLAALAALGAQARFRGRPLALMTMAAFALAVLLLVGLGMVWPTHHPGGAIDTNLNQHESR